MRLHVLLQVEEVQEEVQVKLHWLYFLGFGQISIVLYFKIILTIAILI